MYGRRPITRRRGEDAYRTREPSGAVPISSALCAGLAVRDRVAPLVVAARAQANRYGEIVIETADTEASKPLLGDGFTYRPARPVDWMVCDIVDRPDRVTDLVARWFLEGWCRQCIFNLKLPMKRRLGAAERPSARRSPPHPYVTGSPSSTSTTIGSRSQAITPACPDQLGRGSHSRRTADIPSFNTRIKSSARPDIVHIVAAGRALIRVG